MTIPVILQERTFVNADSVTDEDNSAINYPEDLLNTLAPKGIPPHEIKLKVGCPIMLLRNMSGFKGLICEPVMISASIKRSEVKAVR